VKGRNSIWQEEKKERAFYFVVAVVVVCTEQFVFDPSLKKANF